MLAGICIATYMLTAGSIVTLVSGKSKRLKRNLQFFVGIGFLVYVGIFFVLWNLIRLHGFTFRQFFVITWCLSYLPFAFYLAYATILFVVPELEDQDDYIQASIELKTHFLSNFGKVAWHWRKQYYEQPEVGPAKF